MDEEEYNTIHRWIEICYQEDLKRVEQGQGSASEDDGVYPRAPGSCSCKRERTDTHFILLE